MARITLSEGRWAVLRPMSQRAENLIGDLVSLDRKSTDYFAIKRKMCDVLDEATIEASWEGGFGELPKDETLTALLLWDAATEEEALPPDSGTSSETPSPPGG